MGKLLKKQVVLTKFDIYYHRVDISAGGLLGPESIINPVVSVSDPDAYLLVTLTPPFDLSIS